MQGILKNIKTVLNGRYKTSYSQYGEDQIIHSLLFLLNIDKANYIDIGANDPFTYNNTALLYNHGIFGINIEPDPVNFKKLVSTRKNDINLNVGISDKPGLLTFYKMSDSVYNTFSEKEYEELIKKSHLKLIEKKTMQVETYNAVVEKYLSGKAPTILFIDTEGLDEKIIFSIDFKKYPPVILCVETFSYGQFEKDVRLIEKIKNFGYSVHADTFVNTIFVYNSYLPFAKR